MAREARKLSSTGMYFIQLKGECLFKNDSDKTVFEELLKKYFAQGEVYGYSLSETEIAMVVKEAPNGISMTMKPLTTSYARYFNRTYEISGKLFSDRFKSVPIESVEEKEEFLKNISAKTGKIQKAPQKKTAAKTEKKSDGDNKKTPVKKSEPIAEKKEAEPEKPKRSARKNMPSYLL
ncbi:MAG: hypothetical protein MR413_02600 [Clostridia bacterium]|nr:hypothetical protein [Clostridia bacterium]